MRSAPDSTPACAPDSFGAPGIALDSGGVLAIGIGAATDFFCAAKAAEGASPRTVEWSQMILVRAVRRFGDPRPVEAITRPNFEPGCSSSGAHSHPSFGEGDSVAQMAQPTEKDRRYDDGNLSGDP